MRTFKTHMPFYAVARGRDTGVFTTWEACRASVIGFKKAVFKRFDSRERASKFVERGGEIMEPLITEPLITEPLNKSVASDTSSVYVYTDGACSNNGRAGAVSGIGIFFGEGDPRNVSRRVLGKQTNNTAELTAVLEASRLIEKDVEAGKRVVIVSDSEYVLKCVTTFGERCKREGWVRYIPNRELVRSVYEAFENTDVGFMHVRAHTGRSDPHSIGNMHADRLAVASLA